MIELIAEIGQAHDGSLGILHSFIDALATTGVDTVKFQVHIAEAESSEHEPFRVPFSYEDATRYDYWERMEFSETQWQGIQEHCVAKGLNFLASPFSIAAVDLLEKIGTTRYKIGSGEITNTLMLSKIAATGKPVILSTGLANYTDILAAIDCFKTTKNTLTVLQCTTEYPTPPENWNLQGIQALKKEFNLPIGYSDHSGTLAAGLAVAALQVACIEFHVTYDKRMFGPDAAASLTIDEAKALATGVRQIELGMQQASTIINDGKNILKNNFGKSLAVNQNLAQGEMILQHHLESKKPGNMGIAANKWNSIVGKKLNKDKNKWSFLEESDFD